MFPNYPEGQYTTKIMDGQTDYYSLLGLARNASVAEIKAAFRKLALAHHPDVNADSAQAHAKFVLIANAYATIGNPERRAAYDRFISGSVSGQTGAARRSDAPEKTVIIRAKPRSAANRDYFENHLNYILWDIGDLLMKDHDWRGNKSYDGNAFRKEALTVLTFIDKWVLEPAGLADHFMDARRLSRIDPRAWINTIGVKETNGARGAHAPFTNAENYYYNIRTRMNKYLEKMDALDLFVPLVSDAQEIRIVDALIETQKLSFHYIAYMKAIVDGTHTGPVPAFPHSNSAFDWPK